MKVIVGLGNPGKEYDKTLHNMGYMSVDEFASSYGFSFTKTKYNAKYAEGMVDGEKVILLKPITYMNLSGLCVAECVRKLKLDLKDLLVVYDDIDLPVGAVRIRKSGSAGTHNGMRHIISSLGTDTFARLRVGIGRDERRDLRDYVLSKMSAEHTKAFDDNKQKITSIIHAFIAFDGDVERIDVNNY